jgi:DNA-binding MarR family transcriptional regulator
MNAQEREESLTLEILQTIEQQNDVTQRHLADQLGVALGLTNSYLKRCVRKGLVKIHQAPANRYFYYLTPKGFAEKSRLTANYFTSSLEFYRKAGNSCSLLFKYCIANNWKRIVLAGVSDLAEISTIRAHDSDVMIIGIYDPVLSRKNFLGLPVWHTIHQLPDYDAIIITQLKDVENFYASLREQIKDENRLLVPPILGLKQTQNTETGD